MCVCVTLDFMIRMVRADSKCVFSVCPQWSGCVLNIRLTWLSWLGWWGLVWTHVCVCVWLCADVNILLCVFVSVCECSSGWIILFFFALDEMCPPFASELFPRHKELKRAWVRARARALLGESSTRLSAASPSLLFWGCWIWQDFWLLYSLFVCGWVCGWVCVVKAKVFSKM